MSKQPSSNTTISRQWTKSEKREKAARQIMESRQLTHQINKKFAQQQKMK